MDYSQALKHVHFPTSMKDLDIAKRTVKFVQTYLQQCAILKDNLSSNTNRQVINFEFFQDKVKMSAEAISLHKEASGQSIMLLPNSVKLLQFNKMFKQTFDELNILSSIIDDSTSKENR